VISPFTGCSTNFHAAASELENPFSCFHKVEVFQSLLKPGENTERACKAALAKRVAYLSFSKEDVYLLER
jgi:hypothetical protein